MVVFVIIAALAAVFIIFVLPKLSKGEPKGEYANSDFGGYILFDDGVYAVYGTGGGYEFGTYEVKGDKITFKSANGETDYGKYDKKADTVEYGYLFESNDSKENSKLKGNLKLDENDKSSLISKSITIKFSGGLIQ